MSDTVIQEITLTRTKKKLAKPSEYKVILLNDEVSTFDFVIEVLLTIFHKTEEEAVKLTHLIHNEGSAVVAIYPYDVAFSKVEQLAVMAKQVGFPLKAVCEKVE